MNRRRLFLAGSLATLALTAPAQANPRKVPHPDAAARDAANYAIAS
jgi:hypothetical protein